MNTPRPLILISNDDGVDAPGIEFLARVASRHGDVVVVAPASAQSGKSSALTVNSPLMLKRQAGYAGCDAEVYSVNGTPVDCVKVALHAVVTHRPPLLHSRMNHGSNA
ncbi:MAG: 5'/3'-nucleotidase SurE, partial [Duncaniella sp.]|nr:5'/3'-nucleotidase SurE [Duncaniella sp.]